MSAENWHEDRTKGESAPSLISLWARAIEGTEFDPRLQQAESDAGQSPQPAPEDEPNNHETVANHDTVATLLRAIESTEFAARLQQAEPDAGRRPQPAPGEEPNGHEALTTLLRAIESGEFVAGLQGAPRGAQPDLPAPSETPNSDATLPASTFPLAGPPRKRRVKRPPRDSRFRRLPSAAPPQVAASPAVQQRGPLLDHPHVLSPAKSPAAENAPDSASTSPSASVEDHSPQAPFIARLSASTTTLLDSAEERLATWLRHLLSIPPPGPPPDPRRNQRLFNPPLVAYYWTGGSPRPRAVADISSSGLYLVTHDHMLPGTRLFMTLQRTDQERGIPEWWIAVDVLIVRLGNDGIGGAFIQSMPGFVPGAARSLENCADKMFLERFSMEECGNRVTLERFVQYLTAPDQL